MSLISAIKKRFTLAIALLTSLYAGSAFASEPLKVCAIYPHLKDSYWLSVNYGMVDEALKHKVDLRVLESGGYPNLEKQKEQLSLCVRWNADAIILGTVSPTLYESSLRQMSSSIPVFATVNKLDVDDDNKSIVKGEVGVDWYWMGYLAGQYLKEKHPLGSEDVNIALLPGPKHSGGTKPVFRGFRNAIQDSAITISDTLWADNDKELQRNLVQQVVEKEGIQYIVGSAVAIEAAISELRSTNKSDDIGLVSIYLSHGVYRGLLRDRVEFAPTDKMVLQGRLSMIQAVKYLRGEQYNVAEIPEIEPLTPNNLNKQVIDDSLSPSEFRPTFYIYSNNN